MTTENTIKYLDYIIPGLRKSLEINSNKGPSFEDFCAKKEMNHQLTTSNMPAQNGRAEVAVQIHKNMIKKGQT